MVDQFSDLETKGTTSLIVLLFIVVSKEGGRLSNLLYIYAMVLYLTPTWKNK